MSTRYDDLLGKNVQVDYTAGDPPFDTHTHGKVVAVSPTSLTVQNQPTKLPGFGSSPTSTVVSVKNIKNIEIY